MKTSTISVKCGIYDTAYTIRDYGTHINVIVPYIRWKNNSGSLDFHRRKVTEPYSIQAIRKMAQTGKLYIMPANDDTSLITIDDVAGLYYL